MRKTMAIDREDQIKRLKLYVRALENADQHDYVTSEPGLEYFEGWSHSDIINNLIEYINSLED